MMKAHAGSVKTDSKPANFALRQKENPAPVATDKSEEQKATQLPEPKGYKLLIMLPKADEKTAGGIIKADKTRQMEEVGSICGFVVKMGADAYSDKKRFPSGAYCKVGDWIMMRAYAGTRFAIHGEEFRLINDDSVDAVVEDPRGYQKR